MLLPGSSLTVDFTLRHPTTGSAADADSTPTGVLVRNGTDSGETVTVSNKATGIYKAAATIPGGWSAGDLVQLRIAATVATVADNSTIFTDTLDVDANGSGARSVTITVTDGSNPLQAALVRMAQGAEAYTATTNASGVAAFSLDDATWNVTITKAGYSFTPTTLVVNGTESQTYAMTPVSIPAPASNLKTTAYATIYDSNGDPHPDQSIEFEVVRSTGTGGRGYDATPVSVTSDANGEIQIELLKGTRYRVRYLGKTREFTTGVESTYAIAEFVGGPE